MMSCRVSTLRNAQGRQHLEVTQSWTPALKPDVAVEQQGREGSIVRTRAGLRRKKVLANLESSVHHTSRVDCTKEIAFARMRMVAGCMKSLDQTVQGPSRTCLRMPEVASSSCRGAVSLAKWGESRCRGGRSRLSAGPVDVSYHLRANELSRTSRILQLTAKSVSHRFKNRVHGEHQRKLYDGHRQLSHCYPLTQYISRL